MAYNIIKGRVEFSNSTTGSVESLVDIWRNQSVGGVKTFTSTVSASAFWDTTADGEVRALKSLIDNDAANRVLTSNADGTLNAEATVMVDSGGNLRVTKHVTGSTFSGSAHGLTNIILDADHLAATDDSGRANKLSASFISLGIGMSSSVENTELQVTGGTGIIVDGQGVQVLTASNGGLKFTGQTLQVDAASTTNKGGGPSNNDEFIIADSSDSDSIKNLTYSQIKTAITDSISVPITTYNNSGDNRIITSVNSTTVNGEANLSFDGSNMEMTGGIVVSGSKAIKNDSVPAFRVAVGSGNPLLPDHVSINMGVEARLKAPLAVSNFDGGAQAGIFISKTGSSYLVDGDDIGHVSFNTRGDTTRTGTHSKETSPVAAKIFVEADGSEHNGTSKPGRMSFWTCPSGTINPVERMTINNSGNVGIGTTTIPHTLTVAGTVSASLGVSALSFTGDGSGLTGVSSPGILTAINASNAYTTSSLAIGGNTTPDHKIAVSGAISASLNVSASGFYAQGVTVNDAAVTAGALFTSTLSASSTVNLVGPINLGRGNQTTVSNIGIISSSAAHTVYKSTLDRIIVGNATISDGLIDGTTIGNSAQSSGKFTTLSASGQTDLVGTTRFGYDNYTTISLAGVISSSATATINNATLDRITVGDATIKNGQFSGSVSGSGLLNSIHKLSLDRLSVGAVVGDLSASLGLSGKGVVVDDGGTIGPAADIDLMTLTSNTVSVAGHISSSVGIHVTGSDPHLSVGARRGSSANAIMLNVSPGEGTGEAMNNKILALFKRSEGTDGRTVLAVTGSGKVAVGGANLTGVFNISGSDAETLMHAKSDTVPHAFTLSSAGIGTFGGAVNATNFNATVGGVTTVTLSASSVVDLVGPTNFGKENQTTVSNVGVLSSSVTATLASATLDQVTAGTVSASSTLQAMGVVTVGNGKTTVSTEGVLSSSATATLTNATLDRITLQEVNTVPAGNGAIELIGGINATSYISSSLGFHATGSEANVAIGDHKGTGMVGMLAIRPSGDLEEAENNKIMVLCQRSEASDNRVVFAVSGSGKVACGGAHLDAVLNASGSGVEKLISAKSDLHDPAFYVSGSGDLFVSGDVGVGTNDPAAKLDVNSNSIRIRNSSTPSSAGDTGAAGEIRWDANYIYICIATDTWKRVAISTW